MVGMTFVFPFPFAFAFALLFCASISRTGIPPAIFSSSSGE